MNQNNSSSAERYLQNFRKTGLTLIVQVYVVLGKALINGKLPVEGRWRLRDCIHIVHRRRQPDVFPVVIFTGWAGDPPAPSNEAIQLKELFEHEHTVLGIPWPGKLIAEAEARNTVENILNALKVLKREMKGIRYRVVRFYLVSTDYHLDRMCEVDEFLMELSDIKPLRLEGREVVMERVPYVYATCGDKEREWLAAGYLAMHRCSLCAVNLIGLGGNVDIVKGLRSRTVKPGTIHELRRVPYDTLGDSIRVLEDLLLRVPERGVKYKEVQTACGKIPEALTLMRKLNDDLRPLVGVPFDRSQIKMWVEFRKRLEAIISPLRSEILDPDES